MEKNKKEELISRRSFFKRGISRVLPVLVCATIPTFVASCGPDEPTCSECADSCNANCSTGCYTSCDSSSKSSICSSCASNCEGSSTSTTCSSCANDCTGNCNNSCGSSCGNNCSSSCKDTSTNSGSNDDVSAPSGTVDGHKYVDLGLSVKWAICNVGSSKPEEYGTRFNHLPIEQRQSILQGVYALYGYSIYSGKVVSLSGTQYDKATEKWGNKWCTPTREQCEELINNCEKSSFTLNGVRGTKYTSKKNGNSIFFPNTSNSFGNGYGYPAVVTSSFKLNANSSHLITFVFCNAEFHWVYFSAANERDDYDQLNVRAIVNPNGGSSTSCGNGCSSVCASSSTGSGCSSCDLSCSGGCKTECDYNCAGTCISHCYGSCNDTCGGTCKYVSAGTKCSGCATTCNGRCYRACSYACSSNCESSCVHGSK